MQGSERFRTEFFHGFQGGEVTCPGRLRFKIRIAADQKIG